MRPISRFARLMSSSVSVAPRTTDDQFGKPSYGAATTYRAHVMRKPRLVVTATGQQIVSSQSAFLLTADDIQPTAQATLSTGDVGSTENTLIHPPIMAVERRFDQRGAHHTVLYF